MKRIKKKIKRVSAILTGDWHLQEKQPICRMDNFWETQWEKLTFISNLQKKYNCNVYHSGDLFDHWKPSPMLLSKALEYLPENFYTIFGNHDLPQHNLDLIHKCGIHVLWKAGRLGILEGTHWGEGKIQGLGPDRVFKRKILVWHVMTYQNKSPWPGCTDVKANKLLRGYPEFNLILSGHNHKTFVEEHEGRLLVNPGSIFRLEADQEDHKPCVFLWYAETNAVEPIYLPINEGVISRVHLERKEENSKRIQAFISKAKLDWKSELSFTRNLDIIFSKNKTRKEVQQIILKAIE